MNNKKTFWMNVFFAIAWVLFCLLSFATDIDYVERTVMYKLTSGFIQLLILFIPIITATHLFRSNKSWLYKLALYGNRSCVFGMIFLISVVIYINEAAVINIEFLFSFLFYFLIMMPFLINLKAIKSN